MPVPDSIARQIRTAHALGPVYADYARHASGATDLDGQPIPGSKFREVLGELRAMHLHDILLWRPENLRSTRGACYALAAELGWKITIKVVQGVLHIYRAA